MTNTGLARNALNTLLQQAALVGKFNSCGDLAAHLGVSAVLLLDQASGESLGELHTWSPSTPAGTAAKLVTNGVTAATAAAVLAAATAAAAGIGGVPTPQAVLAALTAGRGGIRGAGRMGSTLTEIGRAHV